MARELKGSRTPKSWRGAFVSIISADGFGYNSGGKLNCQLPVCIEQFFLRCIESTQKMPSALPLPRRLTRVYSICPSFFFVFTVCWIRFSRTITISCVIYHLVRDTVDQVIFDPTCIGVAR